MITIEIDTTDRHILKELFDNTHPAIGSRQKNDHYTVVNYTPELGIEATEVITFIIEHLDSIGTGLIGSYLYDLLKRKKATLKVNYREVEPTKEDITKALKDEQGN